MNQVPVLTIKMVPAGVELVLAALNKLPREQVEGLFQEIQSQANFQLEMMQRAAAAAAQAPVNETEEKEITE